MTHSDKLVDENGFGWDQYDVKGNDNERVPASPSTIIDFDIVRFLVPFGYERGRERFDIGIDDTLGVL